MLPGSWWMQVRATAMHPRMHGTPHYKEIWLQMPTVPMFRGLAIGTGVDEVGLAEDEAREGGLLPPSLPPSIPPFLPAFFFSFFLKQSLALVAQTGVQ